ncbi:MAG: two-component response regulator ORR5-like [Nitrospira sp.]|jgi:two-component system chemotaxis response regulator CheY|nr:two-component response regulator ORR5-like [Nitrospira sp.]
MPILIVEDNAVSAKLAEHLLQQAGYQTVVVNNGNEALEVLPTMNNVQLVITDYMMPEMDGLQLIAKIKALSALKDIPIIILSARCDAGTVKAARGLDCEGFLVKPVEKNQLLERVEQILRDQPQVLCDKTQVMDRLQIGADEYQELTGLLAGQVSTALPIVCLEQAESNEPPSAHLAQLLAELAESATILGADKLSRLHSELIETKSMTRAQLPAMHRTLLELEAVLATHPDSSEQEDSSQRSLTS